MKILIATGIYPPDIGGPAQVARGVEDAWKRGGHEVRICYFGALRRFPSVIRHAIFFKWVFLRALRADFIFVPDTFSAAVPALAAAKLLGRKTIIRIGGDFLWEQFVERTGDLVLLRDFYHTRMDKLRIKERVIFTLLKWTFRNATAVVFSTAWQRDIFAKPYGLDSTKCFIVENHYAQKSATPISRMHPNMPNKRSIVEEQLSYELGGIFFKVHNELGRFCRERQYSDMLGKKLEEKNIHFVRELPIEIAGRKSNFADFVVANKVLIEVKAKDFIGKEEYFQVMRYLESMDLELGLIVNFRNKYLKPQRVLNPKYSKRSNNSGVPFGKAFGYNNSGVPFGKAFGYKVFVGGTRELKWKNISRVNEAFRRARERGIPVALELQTGSREQFLQDIQDSYAVILASLGDVSPNTILEAVSFGKPFILTRETGLYEKLKDIAVFVDPENTDDIVEKIAWLSDEKNYAEQCRKVAGFSFTHSYEEIALEIEKIYRAVAHRS